MVQSTDHKINIRAVVSVIKNCIINSLKVQREEVVTEAIIKSPEVAEVAAEVVDIIIKMVVNPKNKQRWK